MKIIKGASRIYTNAGIIAKGCRNLKPEDVSVIENGAIVYDDKKIIWVGSSNEIPSKHKKLKATDLKKKKCIIPGLIDSHTHLVFAGDRSDEFIRRCAGATYEEIAERGGGILSTMRATREASEDALVKLAIPRVKYAYERGVRTLEMKSGYGLDVESELKVLRVHKKIKKLFPNITFRSTCLAAHAIPPSLTAQKWIDVICDELLPRVKKERLADYVDIFIDQGYFTIEHGKKLLATAKNFSFGTRVHADEFKNTESASLAVEMKALSADHLLKISPHGIQNIAASNTVATLLPGTAYYLKESYAPARALLDAGAVVAIATDFNPGSCPCLDLQWILSLSALQLKMNRAELLSSVTASAAKALGFSKKGAVLKGFDSDFIALPSDSFEQWLYRQGW